MTILNKTEILEYLKTHTWKQTTNNFDISEMTISRLLKQNVSLSNKVKNAALRTLNKNVIDMKSVELRFVYYLLTGKNVSKNREQFVSSIKRLM